MLGRHVFANTGGQFRHAGVPGQQQGLVGERFQQRRPGIALRVEGVAKARNRPGGEICPGDGRPRRFFFLQGNEETDHLLVKAAVPLPLQGANGSHHR